LVEGRAVPGDELRRVFLDAIEEALHDRGLGLLRAAQRPDAEAVVAPQRAGDGHHALHVGGEELAAGGLAAALCHEVDDGLLAHARVEAPDAAQPVDVGNGLDVEDEDRRHQAGNTPVDR
jgi:hypothetical protein